MLMFESSAESSSVPEVTPLRDEENARVIAFYNAARAEVIQRLSLSEQVLLAYLATAGVLAGIAYRTNFAPRSLIMVPIFALPFGLALYRHDESIHRIGGYICKIRPYLLIEVENGKISDWDASDVLTTQLKRHLTIEKSAYAMFLIVPGIFCLVAGYSLLHDAQVLYVMALTSMVLLIAGFIYQFIRLSREKF